MDREPERTWWDETCAVARRQARGAEQPSDAADDLAQDLAVAALENGASAGRMGAWLERVGRNARIDRWRVKRRRHELAGEIEPPSTPPDPEAGVLARERRGVLRRALAALPRPLRRAALARIHADLSFQQVAERLGTREVTARTRVHRALERLRDGLGGLRAVIVPGPGAQATVLGLTLMATVARPGLFPAVESAGEAQAGMVAPVRRAHLVAQDAPVVGRSVAPRAVPRPVVVRPLRAEPPVAAAVQRMSFDEDIVEVGILRPDGESVAGETATEHLSLIELRETRGSIRRALALYSVGFSSELDR